LCHPHARHRALRSSPTRRSSDLRQRRDIAEVELISADEALREFRRDSGFGSAIDALNDNPLPHTLVVRPATEYAEADSLETLARSEEHTSELQSRENLVCRLLLE